jgi:hypothetical protein
MTLVSTVTVGAGGAANITFSSIPQTGTDLLVMLSIRTSAGSIRETLGITFNSLTTSFSNRQLFGTGSASGSGSGNRFVLATTGSGATANTFASDNIYITNYAGSANKSFSVDGVGENNGTEAQQDLYAGLWSNTAAITALSITGDGKTIQQHSTASLYLITKGSGGATTSP